MVYRLLALKGPEPPTLKQPLFVYSHSYPDRVRNNPSQLIGNTITHKSHPMNSVLNNVRYIQKNSKIQEKQITEIISKILKYNSDPPPPESVCLRETK